MTEMKNATRYVVFLLLTHSFSVISGMAVFLPNGEAVPQRGQKGTSVLIPVLHDLVVLYSALLCLFARSSLRVPYVHAHVQAQKHRDTRTHRYARIHVRCEIATGHCASPF